MNKNAWIPIGIVAAIALVLVLSMAGVYNGLIAKNEATKAALSQVETVLQRRYDLIPNLVETVKGYAAQEREVLEEVTRLRSQWGAAKTPDEKAKASDALEGGLGRLMVVVEKYPELKSNQNFRDLQVALEGTENRIAVERQRYNQTLREYNTAVRSFPGSLVAGFAGLAPSEAYFEAESTAKAAPKVDFSTKKE
ncbi:MAG: LemA family protein [Isosphaeraceae bacterium]